MLKEDLNELKPTLANTVLSKVFHISTTRGMNHLAYWSVLSHWYKSTTMQRHRESCNSCGYERKTSILDEPDYPLSYKAFTTNPHLSGGWDCNSHDHLTKKGTPDNFIQQFQLRISCRTPNRWTVLKKREQIQPKATNHQFRVSKYSPRYT